MCATLHYCTPAVQFVFSAGIPHLHAHLPLQHALHHGSLHLAAQALRQKKVAVAGQLLVPHSPPLSPLEQVARGDEPVAPSKDIAELEAGEAGGSGRQHKQSLQMRGA